MASADEPSSFHAHSRSVAQSFLQSVVLLDDRVEMGSSNDGLGVSETTSKISAPAYPGSSSPRAVARWEAFEPRLDAGSVIDAFAQVGAVCAVLSTGLDDSFLERTYKTALRADIVILDWKLEESRGDAALDVMERILLHDGEVPRLRLMAIYTGEPDITTISNRVEQLLNRVYGDKVRLIDHCHMSSGSLRVVILAKPGTLNDATRELGAEEVSEVNIADKLLMEFGLVTGGLLPNVALAGVAAIRDGANKMIAKFSPGLDAAYLGHRMLLPHPPDAEDQLVRALGAEILSILEESKPGEYAGAEAIDMWLDAADPKLLSAPFSFNGNRDPKAMWSVLLRMGVDDSLNHLPEGGQKGLQQESTTAFALDRESAILSNRRFATLLNLKSRYAVYSPRLTIGALVQKENSDPDQYLLCLLPKCDSVRLTTATRVPFVPLYPYSGSSRGRTLRFVLEAAHDQWVYLELAPKLSELVVATFYPGSNPPGEIVAQGDDSSGYVFESEDLGRFTWLAALKDEHAFGIATEVAAALTRPGPDDAEWLRRS